MRYRRLQRVSSGCALALLLPFQVDSAGTLPRVLHLDGANKDSGGAWSYEDYSWRTEGFAQVDNISVVVDGVSHFEDFEGIPSGFLWRPQIDAFAGNHADIDSRITDIDPCRENPTPAIGFVDHPSWNEECCSCAHIQLAVC